VETRGPTEPPHGPAPSLWPLGFAIGITVALVGLVIGSWSAVAVGAVLLLAFGFLWAKDVATGFGAPPALDEAAPGGPETATTGAAVPATAGEAALAPMDDEEIERFPRSKFLEAATVGLGGVIGGIVTVPAVVMAVGDPFVQDPKGDVDIGALEDFPEGQFVIATFLNDPEEGEVSRRTVYLRNNGMKDGQPSFTIVSNRCTHLGCPVQVNGLVLDEQKKEVKENDATLVELTPTSATSGFGCPCHGGQYDLEGNRTAGPPVRALDRYRFVLRNGRLILTKPYSVAEVEGEGADAKIKAYRLVNPSVHVDGPEAILYPLEAP
jgi:menaquinol-cytochrome c reductase iron-sulfur subunit